MFRPFLPCGIAYGFAYGIPCSFSGGRHPAGLFVLYHIGAVLVNRFRQNFGGICLFPAPGGAPVSGGIAPALQARRALAAPYGAEPQRHLVTLPRGRGPSQTPPSLATDSSISPGPPSPWLPALPLYGDVSAVFATNHRVLMQGRMVGFTSTISGLVPWWERHCVTCRYIYLPCPRLRS